MVKLIRNEFKKFSNSYINYVAFGAMLFPLIFTSLIYRYTNSFAFEWSTYLTSLHLFYGIFLGSLIPSFIAIFSVYNEFKEGTMKNLVISPHTRVKLIVSKTIYVMLFIFLLYAGIAVLVLLAGMIIGLQTTFSDVLQVFKLVTLTGMTTVILVPMMIYFTLVSRNFAVPIVITFLATAVGLPIINMGQSYFYPWLVPSNFFFRLGSSDPVDFTMPIISLVVFTLLFFGLSVLRFRRMDFDK